MADARMLTSLANPAVTTVGRDAQRAYRHMSDKEQIKDWSFEPPVYDPSRERRPGRPSARSQNYKKKVEDTKAEKIDASCPQRFTVETPPMDEPLYDIGPHSTLIPPEDVHVQDFDLGGFIPLVSETYEKLRTIDPCLLERLPFSLFLHVCCNHLNLQIAEVARQNDQPILQQRMDLRDALPDYQCLPKVVIDYISHISNALTQTGIELKLNLPAIAKDL